MRSRRTSGFFNTIRKKRSFAEGFAKGSNRPEAAGSHSGANGYNIAENAASRGS
jgi:hypothetical protein